MSISAHLPNVVNILVGITDRQWVKVHILSYKKLFQSQYLAVYSHVGIKRELFFF